MGSKGWVWGGLGPGREEREELPCLPGSWDPKQGRAVGRTQAEPEGLPPAPRSVSPGKADLPIAREGGTAPKGFVGEKKLLVRMKPEEM